MESVSEILKDIDSGDEFRLQSSVEDVMLDDALLYDDVVFRVSSVAGLWVDAEAGDDANNGQSPGQAFRTIQRSVVESFPIDHSIATFLNWL